MKQNEQIILNINAYLKFVEYILHAFDNYDDQTTLGDVRKEFKSKFETGTILLNQYFGIVRLIPLILIKEVYKNEKKELKDDIEKIKIIRDSIAHNSFFIDERGYIFKNNKKELKFSYEEFQKFLHRIENNFYSRSIK